MQFSLGAAQRTPPTLATLVLLSGLSALSMNLFLPSLPNMAVYFDTDYKVMQLSIALYLLINAVLQIVIGPIADKAGRRPVLLWGLALFLLATLGCIYAPNAEIFLVFRMCQAVIVVGIVLSRAAVRDMYDQDQAASMIGYVTMGMAVVPMIGPAIGGILEEAFGWKANFWLPFAIGALTLFLTFTDFGETAAKSGKSLIQQFKEYPELLTSPRFWGYSLACAFSSGAFFAYLGGAPFIGTELFGLSAAQVGIYFGAPAVGYFAGNFISGRYSMRVGVNRMVFWGSLLNAFGVVLSATLFLVGTGTALSFFGLMTFVGIGNGMVIPNATAGSLSVRPHLAATASGLSGAIMLGGGAGLSALAGALLTHETGAMPLLWLMLATALLAICAIAAVIRRERQLGL
ncbi:MULTISPECIES: multidrug effflux MFS transporter [unclassified Ruegeria]|uniref:multidrug effflux MFS transporter n=1 Tax=unclassified Ruegeria TaxID=2625375 RepID=UPI00148887D2|nr:MULTISPECIES: multidrug effflux MFS transporter [unclassified Ruegeria]NOD74673.1 Bcr/CflA family efflux MFS transporter [Ruegeria sp. HKCCD4332]NOD88593.1 Bcr/CflA family efflux MFS transporter [Ruegeria sp. HKCCD4318]NOE12179.1 Bcr/CflA family efflux MFS transporter [Ruegeria sp. HKCCD4318-2]NOG09656.1 multidrug effflux MFS transporter [Ruegeria sp. HKCCD4315]